MPSKHRFTRTVLTLAAFAIATSVSGTALAQEENPTTPGQIPNPGTYQGSQTLQRQSDAQDQAFRQQQQGQQPPQYVPNYGGQPAARNYGGGAPGRSYSLNAHDQCFLMMSQSSSLAALRGLVELGTDTGDPRYFTISRRPTATEKPALVRWASSRRRCNTLTSHPNPAVQQADLRLSAMTDNLIMSLAQGRMTYGEFNYRRMQNIAAFIRFRDSH